MGQTLQIHVACSQMLVLCYVLCVKYIDIIIGCCEGDELSSLFGAMGPLMPSPCHILQQALYITMPGHSRHT